MGKYIPAEQRSALIDLLWKLKHGVQKKENLDFPALLGDPMYRRVVLRRLHSSTRSSQLRSLIDQITDLDPGVDLSTHLALPAFASRRKGASAIQHNARYFVGTGLMLIAATVLIGLIAVKLTAGGAGHTQTAQSSNQLTHQASAGHR